MLATLYYSLDLGSQVWISRDIYALRKSLHFVIILECALVYDGDTPVDTNFT